MNSEIIAIDGLLFNCIEHRGDEFIVVVNSSEYGQLIEIYDSIREIPVAFRGQNMPAKIKDLIFKQIRAGETTLSIKMFWT